MLRHKLLSAALVAAAALFAIPDTANANALSTLPLAHGYYRTHRHVRRSHHRHNYRRHRVYPYRGVNYHYRYEARPHNRSYGYSYPRYQYRQPSRATHGTRTGYRRYDGGHYSYRRSGTRYSGYRRGHR